MAEMRAVAIHPVVSGSGTHPRSVSDEDGVVSCEADVKASGLLQFLTELLHVLRIEEVHAVRLCLATEGLTP